MKTNRLSVLAASLFSLSPSAAWAQPSMQVVAFTRPAITGDPCPFPCDPYRFDMLSSSEPAFIDESGNVAFVGDSVDGLNRIWVYHPASSPTVIRYEGEPTHGGGGATFAGFTLTAWYQAASTATPVLHYHGRVAATTPTLYEEYLNSTFIDNVIGEEVFSCNGSHWIFRTSYAFNPEYYARNSTSVFFSPVINADCSPGVDNLHYTVANPSISIDSTTVMAGGYTLNSLTRDAIFQLAPSTSTPTLLAVGASQAADSSAITGRTNWFLDNGGTRPQAATIDESNNVVFIGAISETGSSPLERHLAFLRPDTSVSMCNSPPSVTAIVAEWDMIPVPGGPDELLYQFDTVTGSGHQYVMLNNSDQLVFGAQTYDGVTLPSRQGIWLVSDVFGTPDITPIVFVGDAAPGTGETFLGFDQMQITDGGDVAWHGYTSSYTGWWATDSVCGQALILLEPTSTVPQTHSFNISVNDANATWNATYRITSASIGGVTDGGTATGHREQINTDREMIFHVAASRVGSCSGPDPCPSTISAILKTRAACQPRCEPDVNCDGNLDQDDVACLTDVIAGSPGCECIDPDFNQDGSVDQQDVADLINVVAGGDCPQ